MPARGEGTDSGATSRPTGMFFPAICLVAAGWDIRQGLDPSSRDNAEYLPERANFSCAYAHFFHSHLLLILGMYM